MARKSAKRSVAAAAKLGLDLGLAPAVIAMRLPLMAAEAQSMNPWRTETTVAFTEKAVAMAEGMVAAQMSLAASASRFWLDLMTGRSPASLMEGATRRAMEAALEPAGRRVRANYTRLNRP